MTEYERVMRDMAIRNRIEHVLSFLGAVFIASCVAALIYWWMTGKL